MNPIKQTTAGQSPAVVNGRGTLGKGEDIVKTYDNLRESSNRMGIAIVILCIVAIWLLPRAIRHGRRAIRSRSQSRYRLRQCVRCGYDIHANVDRCPECGSDLFDQALTHWHDRF